MKPAALRAPRKALLPAFVLALALPPAARPQQQAVIIQHATIVTVTNGTMANGSILLRDGKIAQIGENLLVPAGAQVVDASGRYRDAGADRLPLAHRRRRHQREQRAGVGDGQHDRRARPRRHARSIAHSPAA